MGERRCGNRSEKDEKNDGNWVNKDNVNQNNVYKLYALRN
jgi:hypothetical protein